MEWIQVTKENLAQEHICCALTNDADCQVLAKKAWLAQRFDDGLVFLKGNVRGKCFIEYLPAERAWAPIEADGYLYIDCLWVAGKYQKQGYARQLLEQCIADGKAKRRKGLVILSAKKKKPFLADAQFLLHHGFAVCDTAGPDFALMYAPFADNGPIPQFKPQVKQPVELQSGFVLYYSHQCPFTAKYVPLLAAIAEARHVPLQVRQFCTAEQAQAAPTPFTAFSLFYNGQFITHEILSEKRFGKLLEEKGWCR